MPDRFIFTVTAGRSGQGSLTELLNRHVPGCYAASEESRADRHFKGVLGDLERRFRRRFVETHELLGRGKVLEAYQAGDEVYLDRIVGKRLEMVERIDATIYVDVSKYFARGLHRAFARALPGMGLIRLVRDPVMNMRSFLNRNKNFRLDNSMPDAPRNILCLDSSDMAKGELYLWAWCEMYLRFDRLVEEFEVARAVEIRTEHLADAARVYEAFDRLALPHAPVEIVAAVNTNVSHGYRETRIEPGDVALFERFLARVPPDIRRRIRYFDDYDPARHPDG